MGRLTEPHHLPYEAARLVARPYGAAGRDIYGVLAIILGGLSLYILLSFPSPGPASGIDFQAFLFAFLSLCAISCIAWVVVCANEVRSEQQRQSLAAQNPETPWLGDFPGDPELAIDDWSSGMLALTKATFTCTLCWLVPNLLLAYRFEEARKPVLMVALIPAFFLGLSGIQLARARFRHRANAMLRFHTFPFFLGQELRATLTVQSFPAGEDTVEAILWCKFDSVVDHSTGDSSSSHAASFAVYREFQSLPTMPGEDGTATAEIRFPLPTDADLTSQLSPAPHVYWELEVNSNGRNVPRLSARFLVPVYEKPKGIGRAE